MKFPKLDVDPENMSRVGSGADGIVYHIGDRRVAKFEWANYGWLSDVSTKGTNLQREYEIARELYDGGVSVPEPFGVFSLPQPKGADWGILPSWTGLNRYPAFVMKYIDSIGFGSELDLSKSQLRDRELEKARALGFIPVGYDLDNVLWNKEGNGVYLVDFAHWRKERK